MTTAARHLSRLAVEEYLDRAGPAAIVVPGEPACRITIDPSGVMTLATPGHTRAPDLVDYEHIRVRSVPENGQTWSELLVDFGDRPQEAYLLLCDIADLIQSGHPFETAVRDAVESFEDLLTRGGALGPEQRTGLYGELLFLESCLSQLPAEVAVGAWKGPDAHEHDFVFPELSFEVKSTRTARRHHRIGRLDQLQPPAGSALWLLSIQLTEGSRDARTLPDLVDDVRAAAGAARRDLDAGLARVGWRDRDRPRYRERPTLRTTPRAYLVDDGFPALTRAAVDRSCPRPELIVDAGYTIDLTSFAPTAPPAPAARFTAGDD